MADDRRHQLRRPRRRIQLRPLPRQNTLGYGQLGVQIRAGLHRVLAIQGRKKDDWRAGGVQESVLPVKATSSRSDRSPAHTRIGPPALLAQACR